MVPGVLKESYKDVDTTDGGYQVERLFRKILDREHIAHSNLCCDSTSIYTTVRYNSDEQVLEFYSPADDEWQSMATVDSTFQDIIADSVTTDTISEKTTGAGITFTQNLIRFNTLAAHDVTGTATAAEVVGGVITSTSAAAVSLTLPTVAQIVTATGATRGTVIDFAVDNGVGSNTVTVVAGTGMAASSAVTGGTTLTVASGVVGQFRLYIQSGTTAKLSRIA